MPALVAWLLGGLGWVLTSAVGQILTALGLAFVIQEYVIGDWIESVSTRFGALPAFVAQMLGFFGVDKAITIILSAYGVRFASNRISGVMRRTGAAAGAG